MELITIRVIGREDVIPLKVARIEKANGHSISDALLYSRPTTFDDGKTVETPRYDRGRLKAGHRIRRTGNPGPAQLDNIVAARIRRRGRRLRQPARSSRLRAAHHGRTNDRSDYAASDQRRPADHRRRDGPRALPHVVLFHHPRIAGSRRRIVRHRVQHAVRSRNRRRSISVRFRVISPGFAIRYRAANGTKAIWSFTTTLITDRVTRRTSRSSSRFSMRARWSDTRPIPRTISTSVRQRRD